MVSILSMFHVHEQVSKSCFCSRQKFTHFLGAVQLYSCQENKKKHATEPLRRFVVASATHVDETWSYSDSNDTIIQHLLGIRNQIF